MLMQMLVQSFGGDEAFHHQGDNDKLEHYKLVTTLDAFSPKNKIMWYMIIRMSVN